MNQKQTLYFSRDSLGFKEKDAWPKCFVFQKHWKMPGQALNGSELGHPGRSCSSWCLFLTLLGSHMEGKGGGVTQVCS